MDPLIILSAANAAFTVVKKVTKAANEAEEVYKALSKWAGHISDLQEFISQEKSKPSIFKKIVYNKSATAEAFDSLVAERRIAEMEKEIKSSFLVGSLCHLGLQGYREFIRQRRIITDSRKRELYDQMRRRKAFFYNSTMGLAITIVGTLLVSMIWFLIDMIKEASQ